MTVGVSGVPHPPWALAGPVHWAVELCDTTRCNVCLYQLRSYTLQCVGQCTVAKSWKLYGTVCCYHPLLHVSFQNEAEWVKAVGVCKLGCQLCNTPIGELILLGSHLVGLCNSICTCALNFGRPSSMPSRYRRFGHEVTQAQSTMSLRLSRNCSCQSQLTGSTLHAVRKRGVREQMEKLQVWLRRQVHALRQ